MSRAGSLARAFGSDGTLNTSDVSGLAAVASSGSASDLSTGTLPIDRIADTSVTAAKLHTTAVTDKLGYTPVNKAGDTMTGALSVFVNDGDLKGVRTFHGDAAVYNPATDGTPNKIVSGVDIGWYSDSWRIGATRGGGADIQELMFVRSSNSTVTKHFGIDGSGRVTMPYQPAFKATLAGGYTYTLNNTNRTPTYGYVVFNTGSHYNSATSTFTAPVAGDYLISMGVVTNAATAASFVVLEFDRNGTTDYASFTGSCAVGAAESGMCLSQVVKLAAGDAVRPRLYAQADFLLGSSGSLGWPHLRTFFSGRLLG